MSFAGDIKESMCCLALFAFIAIGASIALLVTGGMCISQVRSGNAEPQICGPAGLAGGAVMVSFGILILVVTVLFLCVLGSTTGCFCMNISL
jgi:hypothetical protein